MNLRPEFQMRKLSVMVNLVNLLKTLQIYNLKRFYKLFLSLCFLLISTTVCGIYLNEIEEEYNLLFPKVSYVKSLKANAEKFNFIQKHKFENSSNIARSFQNIISDCSKKYKMIIKRNDIKSESNINGITIDTCNIELLSWHDSYIFEMIEKLRDLSPGFVTLESFDITRVSNINLKFPALKVQILCKLYYKQ